MSASVNSLHRLLLEGLSETSPRRLHLPPMRLLQDYVPEEDDEPASPPRPSAGSRARAAAASTLSPTTQAAVTMASLLGGGGLPAVRPAVVGRPTKREEDDDPDATIEGLTTRPTRRAPSRPGGRPGAQPCFASPPTPSSAVGHKNRLMHRTVARHC